MEIRFSPFTTQSRKNTAFGVKVPTVDVMEVVTRMSLKGGDVFGRVGHVADVMYNESPMTIMGFNSNLVNGPCTKELIRQFPVLKGLRERAAEYFATPKSPSEIDEWINKQIKIIGSQELDVKPFDESV